MAASSTRSGECSTPSRSPSLDPSFPPTALVPSLALQRVSSSLNSPPSKLQEKKQVEKPHSISPSPGKSVRQLQPILQLQGLKLPSKLPSVIISPSITPINVFGGGKYCGEGRGGGGSGETVGDGDGRGAVGGGGGGKSKRTGMLNLPLSRIRTVMKTAPNSNAIALNSSVALAKAAELFVAKLAQESLVVALESHSARDVEYAHLAKAVRKNPRTMKFLFEFLPHKVIVQDYIQGLIASNPQTKTTSSS